MTYITEGDIISITLAAAYNSGSGSLATMDVTGTVSATTDKAVQLSALSPRGKTITAWFPRKALAVEGHQLAHSNHRGWTGQLARWFRPTGWTAKFLDLAQVGTTLAPTA